MANRCWSCALTLRLHCFVTAVHVESVLSDPSTMLSAGSLVIGTSGVISHDVALAASRDAAELIARLREQYPQRLLPLIPLLSAQAAFGSEH